MRAIYLIIICILSLSSCNQVNDLQTIVPEAVPSSVIKHVTDQFPQAENLVFKSLIEKQIWEVRFNSASDRYVSLVDSLQMSQTYRFNPDNIPTEITDLLSVGGLKGGTLSENREDIGFYNTSNRRNRATYTFNGNNYVLEAMFLTNRLVSLMFSPTLYSVNVERLSGLPAKAQEFFRLNPDLTFDGGGMWIMMNYDKLYDVQVKFDKDGQLVYGRMLFDADGNLKWISRSFNEPESPQSPTNVTQMPEPMRLYIEASPELTEFYTLSNAGFLWRGEYKGASSYFISFSHKTMSQTCEMYFDKDGNLLLKTYYYGF